MKPNRIKRFLGFSFILFFFNLLSVNGIAQTYDTISNWDGIAPVWVSSTGTAFVVNNPTPDTVNSSNRCLKVVSTSYLWDNIKLELPDVVNFETHPRYRLKVLAPSTAGDIAMRFQNANASLWCDIVATPVPGSWTDFEFDFSACTYDNLKYLVIFFDFNGTTNDRNWYFDDVLREQPQPLDFESNLPIVVINTFGVPIPDEPKIDGIMGIINNGNGQMNQINDPFNEYDGPIGIEIRGQSSQMFPKKSYSFETRDASGDDFDVSLLGMPAESDWVLYAPYSDKSMLRNVLTFEMGHLMGEYCTRTVFCEVVVNGDYKGVYVLMEKIKKNTNRVNIATLKPNETSGSDLTGGYILRVDKIDPGFTFGIDGWKSIPNPPYPNAMPIIFQYYYPKVDNIVEPQRIYIKDFITEAENTLISPGFADPDNGYQKYFDVASFIDFMLLNEITKEVDKYRYSNYMYKQKDTDGGKLFAGPAWDFNLGYGNVDFWPPGLEITGWLYEMVTPDEWSIMFWWKRLMEDPYFHGLAKTRWQQLRQNKLSYNNVNSIVNAIVSHISDAKDRNYERWPILGTYVWPNFHWLNNTYQDEVIYFKDYLFNRMSWMDYNFDAEIIHPTAKITAQANQVTLKLNSDYFATHLIGKEHFQLNNVPLSINIQSVSYVNAHTCTMLLNGLATQYPHMSVTVSETILNSWNDLTSSDLIVSEDEITAVKENFKVFSGSGNLVIRANDPQQLPSQAFVYNATGVKMLEIALQPTFENKTTLTLSSGIYFVVLNTKTSVLTYKIVVQN